MKSITLKHAGRKALLLGLAISLFTACQVTFIPDYDQAIAAQIEDAFDFLYKEAEEKGGGRLLALSIHPWMLGQPHRIGKFEQANGGTLLLDEISEMPLGLQAKLLRVIQEREVERIGGKKMIDLDVRIIATTNRDIAGAGHNLVR